MDKKQGLFGIKDGIYLIIAPLVIILPISYWYFNLPPEGFCQAENRRLTDQERIEKVVKEVLRSYPQVTHREAPQVEPSEHELADGQWLIPPGEGDGSWRSTIMSKPSYPLPYKGIKEFFELNPTCCLVTQNYQSKYHDGGGEVTFWDRITGVKTSIVVVMWHLRYLDNDNVLKTEMLETYRWMDNCGNFVAEY